MNKEEKIAKQIITHYENLGYTCYKEVSKTGTGGAIRCDCYFTKKYNNGEIIDTFVVETKTTMCLKVIEQAFNWKSLANKTFVGIPKPKNRSRKEKNFALHICKMLGIGIIEVGSTVNILLNSEYNSKYKLPPLHEQQLKSKAGNSKSEFYTEFKGTLLNIDKYMKDKKECDLKIVISNITHHYSNDLSAISCIKNYIKKGIIKNYKLKRGKRCILIEKV